MLNIRPFKRGVDSARRQALERLLFQLLDWKKMFLYFVQLIQQRIYMFFCSRIYCRAFNLNSILQVLLFL